MSTGKGKENADEDVAKEVNRVQCLIEKCMLHYLNQNEVTDLLYEELKIEPGFTKIVWEELEKKNTKLFENYNAILKELTEKKVPRVNELMKNTVTSLPESSGSSMPPNLIYNCGPSGMLQTFDFPFDYVGMRHGLTCNR